MILCEYSIEEIHKNGPELVVKWMNCVNMPLLERFKFMDWFKKDFTNSINEYILSKKTEEMNDRLKQINKDFE